MVIHSVDACVKKSLNEKVCTVFREGLKKDWALEPSSVSVSVPVLISLLPGSESSGVLLKSLGQYR